MKTSAWLHDLSDRVDKHQPDLCLESTVTVANESAQLRVVSDARLAQVLRPGSNAGLDFSGAPTLAFSATDGARIAAASTEGWIEHA